MEQKKLFLFDFDGTLTNCDMLDEVLTIVDKKQQSIELNKLVTSGQVVGSLKPLCTRINFLQGVSLDTINEFLQQNDFLRPGVRELFDYLNKNDFITVIISGNITPTLSYYQKLLNVTHIVGTQVPVENGVLQPVDHATLDPDFKKTCSKQLIEKLQVPFENTYAIGDSIVDREMLQYAKHTFTINPKGGIENYANVVLDNDLSEIINYIK